MLNPSILSGPLSATGPGTAFVPSAATPTAQTAPWGESGEAAPQSGLSGPPSAFGTALAAAAGPFNAAFQLPVVTPAPVAPAPIPAPPPVEFATGLATLPPVAFGKAAPPTGKALPPAAPTALALPDVSGPFTSSLADQAESESETEAEPALADGAPAIVLTAPIQPALFAAAQPVPVAAAPFETPAQVAVSLTAATPPAPTLTQALPADSPMDRTAPSAPTRQLPFPPATAAPSLALQPPVAREAGLALARTAELVAAPLVEADKEPAPAQASLRVALRSAQEPAAAPVGATLAARIAAPAGRDPLRAKGASVPGSDVLAGSPTVASTVAQPFAASSPTAADGAAAPAAPRPMDFATLVDSIARARDEMAPRVVSVRLSHEDFGPVSLHFRHDGDALAVTMASADPGLVRAAAQAAPADQQAQGQSQPQSQSQGQAQSQPQGQATAQGREGGHPGQRGAARDPSAASAEPRADQTGGSTATAPDIYA